MATNKVIYNGKTLIDLTNDTVTADNLVEGITAHNKSGSVVTGTVINTGKGTYVWKKYKAVPSITKTRSTTSLPNGYSNITEYQTYTITDDGYFYLGKGYGLDIYLLPTNATNGKTKNIAFKGYGQTYYYIWTLGDEINSKGAFIGYISSNTSSDYPDNGIQDGYYYVKLSESTSSDSGSGSSTSTSDATASASDILTGKTAYISSGKTTGTMKNNSAVTGTISTKADSYTVPAGYHNGSGKVSISSTEQNKIIASNIKSGVSILGVTGSYTGDTSSSSSSNNNCEAYLVDVTSPTVSFKTTSGTIKAYGYAVATSSGTWGSTTATMCAFNGTSYYKSSVYGSPTSTSISLSVSNGQLTGLPSLTSGTLLVTRGI